MKEVKSKEVWSKNRKQRQAKRHCDTWSPFKDKQKDKQKHDVIPGLPSVVRSRSPHQKRGQNAQLKIPHGFVRIRPSRAKTRITWVRLDYMELLMIPGDDLILLWDYCGITGLH